MRLHVYRLQTCVTFIVHQCAMYVKS